MEKQTCPICGHDVTDESDECKNCGEPLIYVVQQAG